MSLLEVLVALCCFVLVTQKRAIRVTGRPTGAWKGVGGSCVLGGTGQGDRDPRAPLLGLP